jgi:hypothetical protein
MYEDILYQHPDKEAKRLQEWETKIDTMGEFPMQAKFAAAKETNKYARFTGYLKEYVTDMLSGSGYRVPNIEGVCAKGFLVATFAGNKFPKNWWETAIDVANGKKVEKPLPSIDTLKENTFGEMDKRAQKDNIYAAFMPMYRALKERNDKRWFFERIFNRKQFIAERDSLKALTGLMMSLTGETKEDINNVLAEYKNAMNDSGRTSEERRAEAARIKKVAKENGPQIIQDYSIHDIEKKPIHNEEIKEKIEVDTEVDTKDIGVELAIGEGKDLDKSINSIAR